MRNIFNIFRKMIYVLSRPQKALCALALLLTLLGFVLECLGVSVMLEPVDKHGKAFIFEFKVLDSDEDEETLEDTLAAAHRQIEEKQYEAELVSRGFAPDRIRKYGFAFKGKEVLIG